MTTSVCPTSTSATLVPASMVAAVSMVLVGEWRLWIFGVTEYVFFVGLRKGNRNMYKIFSNKFYLLLIKK